MKIAVTGAKNAEKIIEAVKRYGFQIDMKQPDFVITYGGDGSILYAEREYPGIPKITILASTFGFKCVFKESDLGSVLDMVKAGTYKLREEMKIEARAGSTKYVALNEVQLRNKVPVKTIRFSVYADGKPLFEKVVGDGVVIATPFGSAAYFSSVGGREFKKGIGIALNNPHKFKGEPFRIVDASAELCIKVLRDYGMVYYDNADEHKSVKDGDEIHIKAITETAKFVIP